MLLTSIYLIMDGLFHLLDFKLITVSSWPLSSLTYSSLIGHLYGAFAILSGLFGIEAQRNMIKYKNFIYIVAVWLIFYSCLLIYSSMTIDFQRIFVNEPSVYAWMPFYNSYLLFEAFLGFLFSVLTYLWKRSEG